MGYLMIDHRGGMDPAGKKGTLIEYDTSQCPHCGGVVEIRRSRSITLGGSSIFGKALSPEDSEPRPDDMFCGKCHAFICPNPQCRTVCVPFMKKLLMSAARKTQQRRLSEALTGALARSKDEVEQRRKIPTWVR